jgi:type II secretory pathway component GspD/PulD (secretin)
MRTSLFVLLVGLASCGSLSTGNRPNQDLDHTLSVSGAPKARPDFQMVPLKFALAEDTAKVINDFLGRESGAPRRPELAIRVVADPRTNSLLVQAPSEDLPRVLELVAKLDRKVP